MKTLRSTLLLLCLAAWSSASATTVIPPTFDQLVERADVIFEGTVTDVRSQWAGQGGQRHIQTYVTFKVNEKVKGEPGATYTLQMLGGTVGDETMEVTDSPKFVPGDRDILFVENNGRQFVPLVGIMHGRFHVQRDAGTGKETVANHHHEVLTDLAKIGHEEAVEAVTLAAPSETPLSVASFKAAIRARLVSGSK